MKIISTVKKIWTRVVLLTLSIVALPSRVMGGNENLGNADDNLQNLQKGIGGNVPTDLSAVVGNVIKTVLSLVGIIFLVLTVYAGYLWMTARGEDEQVSKAKEIIKSSIMGLFIVVSSYAITVFITSRFSGQ
ncbi:MAG TPA: hypothetical protein PK295_02345 [Candidatus Magasanikbacteria bacterium]|nr:hypothetical protein [Candidatus Magasanikbacteria bacterium]